MDTYKYDPQYKAFSDYMGVDRNTQKDYRTSRKMEFLFDWAKDKSEQKDLSATLDHIGKTKRSMGVNFTGKLLVNKMYQTVRLSLDRERLQNKK